jgi:Bacterial Ig-like domain (group 2)
MRYAAFRSSRRALRATLVIALVVAGISCSDKSDIGPGRVVAVRVAPDTLRVILGRTDTARAFPLDGADAFIPRKSVTWAIADANIATINDSGVVTGVALGTTQISATSSGAVGTGTVVVDPVPSMTFLPDSGRLAGIAGSPSPATSNDTVSNAGGGVVSGLTLDSITYPTGPTGWLQATLGAAEAPAPVDLSADPSALGLGRYVALVWFTSPTATPTTGAMPVVLVLTPDVPTTVAPVGGNGQTTIVNSQVATAPSVRVSDQFNNPVAGVSVAFTIASGGGSVVGGNATTGVNGVAAVTSWTLGTVAGTNTLEAASAGLAGSPVTFTATGTPAPASQLVVNAGDNQAAIAGTAVSLAPSARTNDPFGNAVSGIGVTFAVTGGGGTIGGAGQTTNASGVAQVGSWTLGPTAGVNTLTATAPGLGGSPVAFTATGNPGNATTIALSSGSGQSATVATTLPTPFTALVTDINSNPVQGITVGWAATSGGGSMNPASSVTDVNGLASSTRTLGGTAGTQNATATVAGLTGSPVIFSATGTAGTVTQILVNGGNNQTATVNTAVATAPSAIARDAFSNPVPGAAVTFTVTAGGGAVNCGAGNTTACNVTTSGTGVATVTSWTVGTAVGTNTMTATRAGASGTSFTASGSPGAVAFVSITAGNSQSARPGVAVTTDPTVLVRDAFLNPVPGATVNFAIASGNGVVNCGAGNTTSCNVTSSGTGVATVANWNMGNTGLPTVAAPSLGRYTNTLNASSNAVTTTFTGFGVWSYASDVRPLMAIRASGGFGCESCHPGISTYTTIVGVVSSCGGSSQYIAPSSLANSLLYQKIIPAGADCTGGSRMPTDGLGFMAQTQYDRIRDWILNGAPNN